MILSWKYIVVVGTQARRQGGVNAYLPPPHGNNSSASKEVILQAKCELLKQKTEMNCVSSSLSLTIKRK